MRRTISRSILMFCKFEPVPSDDSKFNFSKANCEVIIDELDSIDWVSIFAWKRVDDCVDLFYEIVFDCFDHNVPRYRPRGGDWLPWESKCSRILKNKANKAAKNLKLSESRCMSNGDIDDCECERLRENFVSARSDYQLIHRSAYDDYREKTERSIKKDPKTFFRYVDLKKERVGYPSVMKFGDRKAASNEDKCELFADFLQHTYTNDE
jgi:hypothetical protein